MESETLEQMQARHRKEQRDLVARTTQKKKNATKKTRKGVNDECADMERRLREKQEEEVAALTGAGGAAAEPESEDEKEDEQDAATRDVAEKLEKTTISEPAPQDQTQTQGGGGKKRNRQKERMARRAAEQEEAMSKAEEEASNMTDHRGIEKTYMLNEFKAHSLSEQEIAPDGHCLFSAVADQLRHKGIPLAPGSEQEEKAAPPYKVVRRRAAEWMEAHPDDFAPFLEEGLEGYVGKIRDTAEWGGQLELVALSGVYGVEIRVVQDGRTERIGEGEEVVWLAYYRHGYGLGEHYNSLRKTTA
ncbi:OTU-like cysteine protease [Colletotrichum karsti]|uniref:OTU-like cysteine protease n=1 Tax=Colletotrichum karsti TaxID=1095194 RepID=A0A9P6IG86_9PEZI|nr:OTU-like cysteine protease [Colletotrichum karsti]KAF9882319.1 OTU-like cysteine protease [Colletotrichum karsti]